MSDLLSALFIASGIGFYLAGSIGLLRLPDLHSRLHALTKADNVGLGFTVFAAMLQAEAWATVFKLALIWLLVLAAGATVCFLIAERARLADATSNERAGR
mgnify:CR=1 FL=1